VRARISVRDDAGDKRPDTAGWWRTDAPATVEFGKNPTCLHSTAGPAAVTGAHTRHAPDRRQPHAKKVDETQGWPERNTACNATENKDRSIPSPFPFALDGLSPSNQSHIYTYTLHKTFVNMTLFSFHPVNAKTQKHKILRRNFANLKY
jgi:hypothetical protein